MTEKDLSRPVRPRHRFRASLELDAIAASDGSGTINGGGVTAHRLAELSGGLSVALDADAHCFDVRFTTPTGEDFSGRFDHFPTPTELWEFVTTRSLHLAKP